MEILLCFKLVNVFFASRVHSLFWFPDKTLFIKVIACLDVRTNDKGDLVVTKGDQYDVREHTKENEVSAIVLILLLYLWFLSLLKIELEYMPRHTVQYNLLVGVVDS